MLWFCVWQIISALMGFIRLGCRSESDKDLGILLLRHQLALYERKQGRAPHLSRGKKLIFIETGTHRMHFAGCTAHPDNARVTQQVRQAMWKLEDPEPGIRFLIRDNDQKFTQAFDTVFRSEGIDVIPTPYHAPMPTRTRSGGSAPYAKRVWISC